MVSLRSPPGRRSHLAKAAATRAATRALAHATTEALTGRLIAPETVTCLRSRAAHGPTAEAQFLPVRLSPSPNEAATHAATRAREHVITEAWIEHRRAPKTATCLRSRAA